MDIKVGDSIIWTGQLESPQDIREGLVTKVRTGKTEIDSLLWVDNLHAPEDCIYAAFCWPARVKEDLRAILVERQRLKKAYNDSMGLVYKLRNEVTRGEK